MVCSHVNSIDWTGLPAFDNLVKMSDVTRLLGAIGQGNLEAGGELLPLVYQELRRLAQGQMGRERSDHTLQATALVHEAYLRLIGDGRLQVDGSGHFFAIASEAMRRILVEHARKKLALRNGGGIGHVQAGDDIPDFAPGKEPLEIIAINEALDQLAAEYPVKAELVKLRYFGGLDFDEAAAVLQISRSTANRHWKFARAWLLDRMSSDQEQIR